MSKDRTIVIQARPDIGNPGEFLFAMLDEKGDPANLIFNKNNDKLKKSQYYTINFVLENLDNADLKFSKDPKKVMWSKYVPSPTSPCIDKTDECHLAEIFVDPATPIQDLTMTVINVDRTVNHFALAFNFLRPGTQDGPGTDYAFYDPIGSNQDGGLNLSLTSTESVGGFVGGLVIGGLIGAAFS